MSYTLRKKEKTPMVDRRLRLLLCRRGSRMKGTAAGSAHFRQTVSAQEFKLMVQRGAVDVQR